MLRGVRREALDLYERREDVVSAAHTRELIDELADGARA